MEWPTAGIGLKGALGEESLAHDWRIEQLERLGLLFQSRTCSPPRLTGTRWERSSHEAAHLNRLGATDQSPWGGFSRLLFGGIAKEASEGG
jgi:hypothetical protein